MALARYNPLHNLPELQREMNRLFEERHPSAGEQGSKVMAADWSPAVDVHEAEGEFQITADIPGVDPQDIEVSVENGVLTIRGERSEQSETDEGNYRRMERFQGTFFRRFTLPDTADAENIKAQGNNGVLQIRIPKQERAQARKIEVES
jgi:HSP20 family protein